VKTKRIVITGGPGTGKSSLIHKLEAQGYECLHEISRQVILEARKQGINQLFLAQPLLFSRKLLQGRVLQYREAGILPAEVVFVDRGIPDIVAYMDYAKTSYPKDFITACEEKKYHQVFILPPWEEIYVSDSERHESFKEAERIYPHLVQTYSRFGYKPLEVPRISVQERVDYLLNNIDA